MSQTLTPDELAQVTPMLRQFYELKAKAKDAILFFRMGDFYEIFGEDAEEVAPKLDLMMTSRERGDKNRIPFCGVPHHSAKGYWLRLLKLGYSVAIADQMENPSTAKGLVRRDITQIMTPGAIDDPEALESDKPNHLVALFEEPKKKAWVLAALDTSTGDLRVGNIERGELDSWLQIFQPKEILARKFMHDELKESIARMSDKVSLATLPEAILRDESLQLEFLKKQFAVKSLAELPCGAVVGGLELLAATFQYLEGLKASIAQFLSARTLREDDRMILDETVRRDLELFETLRRRDAEGSLLKEINHTRTPMGARLLRYDLARPYVVEGPIRERQEALAEILKQPAEWLVELRDRLKASADLDRLTTRVLSGKAAAGDLHNIRLSLEIALKLGDFVRGISPQSKLLQRVGQGVSNAKDVFDILQSSLAEQPGALGSLDVFLRGYDPDFDELCALSRDGQARIDDYEQKLRNETGISSLKIKEHKSYGRLIEVTKPNLSKVPSHFIRRQTMVNNERFMTVELEELDEVLSSATEKALSREIELFLSLMSRITPYQEQLRSVSAALALLDLVQSFAHKASHDSYVKPRIAADGSLKLLGARHPVVERWVGRSDFMPNDMLLGAEAKQMVITGPNMAGKSTVMRQTAICAILHQIGSYVPCREAEMPIFDKVFTRVGAADDLSRGQSTFMVEMSEAAAILRQATSRSLVILDEVGRGTSTEDGLAIASAILEYIAEHVKSYTLFATHYHELVEFCGKLPSVQLAQVEVLEVKNGIRFTHRLIEGASGSSFGLEVAKLAGVPEVVIKNAKIHMDGHASQARNGRDLKAVAEPGPESKKNAKKLAMTPLELGFGLENATNIGPQSIALRTIQERLERLNVLKTTPLQALALLDELKTLLEQRDAEVLFHELQPYS